MFLSIILKDVKEAAEELSAGFIAYAQVMQINVGFEIVNRVLQILIPLLTAYLIHKLKKHYWEQDRPFFKNIISDIRNWIKQK